MAKRIHELGKELNVPNKDIISFLRSKGFDVTSHANNIDEKGEALVRGEFAGKKPDEGKAKDKTEGNAAANNAENEAAQLKKEHSAPLQNDKKQNVQDNKSEQAHEAVKTEKAQTSNDANNAQGTVQQDKKPQSGTNASKEDRNMQNNNSADRRQQAQPDRKTQGSQNNQNDRRQPGQTDRKPFNGQGDKRVSDGERRNFNGQGGRNVDGERRNFNGQGRNNNDGERKNFNGQGRNNNDGERRNFNGQGRNNNDGERKNFNGQGDRKTGDRKPFNNSNRSGQGAGRGGFDKDMFDKDKDSGYGQRNFSKGRNDSKNSDKSSLKSDLANELTKEQRAAAFNDKSRDRNRERNREHEMEDGLSKSKGKKDPNRKGAFIMPKPKPVEEQKEDEIKTIIIPEIITIKELADKMKKPSAAVIKKLFLKGKVVSINQEISFEEAEEIALGFNCIAEKEVQVDIVEELLKEDEEPEELMIKRPPVVCVMGHVDHGKTSLLDAIRESNVTAKEAGGITQHIGAYVVDINGEKITFLDTPGHEAFTSMRMRGAKSTDIAILVVAADDGVMPQTVEAISHARAAGVQIIVAVNKIDKPSANVERVKQELTEHGLVAEDWGGDTVFVPVSAHTKEGIDTLLEMILLTAEVCELKANPNRKARGIVIEAELDRGKGTVATVLVQKGTLHVGDSIAIGSAYGKVRAMVDDKGRKVKEATPSTPVEILGLNEVPNAGEIFIATDNEKEARNISEAFIKQGREKLLADTKSKLSLDGLFSQIQAGNIKELNIIVKADVQGSVEAVKQSLLKLSNEEVAVRIIHGGVGAINESDVTLAATSNAIIIGFNVRPDNTARETAEREKVDLRLYRVIYDAISDVESAMKGMLDPTYEEKIIGHAEVRQTFKASGLGVIAGSYVLDGKIVRGCSARISRDGEQLYDGPLASLKRFKDDVKEVAAGYECGLVFEKFNDLKEFDQVELYMMVEVPR